MSQQFLSFMLRVGVGLPNRTFIPLFACMLYPGLWCGEILVVLSMGGSRVHNRNRVNLQMSQQFLSFLLRVGMRLPIRTVHTRKRRHKIPGFLECPRITLLPVTRVVDM